MSPSLITSTANPANPMWRCLRGCRAQGYGAAIDGRVRAKDVKQTLVDPVASPPEVPFSVLRTYGANINGLWV